jgi:hypothetical protein
VERRRAERPEDLVGRQCIVGDQQSDAGREALADDVPVVEKLDLRAARIDFDEEPFAAARVGGEPVIRLATRAPVANC